ncbi:hypothetical protein E2C01_018648 [Portunus trituberculatus]|uniref:Uncharacterized protein n=1 Tax=Portunus trituberculatus TaxID=210409 RepID=A0A5B7DVJ3_PORTR|nr:hypothetical protein [Portunus trituberculatus]
MSRQSHSARLLCYTVCFQGVSLRLTLRIAAQAAGRKRKAHWQVSPPVPVTCVGDVNVLKSCTRSGFCLLYPEQSRHSERFLPSSVWQEFALGQIAPADHIVSVRESSSHMFLVALDAALASLPHCYTASLLHCHTLATTLHLHPPPRTGGTQQQTGVA